MLKRDIGDHSLTFGAICGQKGATWGHKWGPMGSIGDIGGSNRFHGKGEPKLGTFTMVSKPIDLG